MKSIIYCISLFSLIIICSCSNMPEDVELALKLSGDNKEELLKVINHYSDDAKDSLKLKAAIFLISNMPYHSWLDYGEEYNNAFKKAGEIRKHERALVKGRIEYLNKNFPNDEERYPQIQRVNARISWPVFHALSDQIDSINKKAVKKPNKIFDLQNLTAEFLIENIELSFDVYDNNNLKLCDNFEDFLEYILPYRVLTEPVEKNKRKYFLDKYGWAKDSLKIKTVEKVVSELYYGLGLSGIALDKVKSPYRGVPSLSQIEATRFGNCEHLALYFVSILRSIGIPSGVDYSQRWGHYPHNMAHSWVFYKEGNQFKTFNIGGFDHELVKLYSKSNVTKIYRNTFSKPEKNDVTDMYHDVENIAIDILWDYDYKNSSEIHLGVFSPKGGWDKVAKANEIKNNKAVFKKVGVNLGYVAFFENEEGQHLINYPFEIDKKGHVHYLKADSSSIIKGVILRKYPLVHHLGDMRKITAMKSLNGCILQGSNNMNSGFKNIYEIKDFFSSHELILPINTPVKFKFYRFYKPGVNNTQIASFCLLDNGFNEIKNYTSITSETKYLNDKLKALTDHNPLSYINSEKFSLDYHFDRPIEVSGIKVQAKNDDNHINKGELYELLFWDKKWISLGERKANDTVLHYNSIPKNALYWLKNKTKGVEEYVFTIDKNGKQFWPSFDNEF